MPWASPLQETLNEPGAGDSERDPMQGDRERARCRQRLGTPYAEIGARIRTGVSRRNRMR